MKHTISTRVYYVVFFTLLVLTLSTLVSAGLPLGQLHTTIAIGIAILKATLVILFFMHVLYSNRLTWVVIAAALLMLGILLAFTMTDYLTRHWLH